MAKSKRQRKSNNWVKRQNRDHFVQKARSSGYRARAIFKLEEIDLKYRLIKPVTRLVDLGAAPGSWCQYAASRVTDPAQILAVDLLDMEPVAGIRFIQGDFTDPELTDSLFDTMQGQTIDLVLSDMAPNITGIRAADQARTEAIQQSILHFCSQALRPAGTLLTKLFEGEAAQFMRAQMKSRFTEFAAIKPDASRSESREIFLLARGYRPE